MPIGSVTRGTTGTNRLRRTDRWIVGSSSFLGADAPLVVDLGFGASPTTVLELHRRLTRVRPLTEVVGIEIDPARVAFAAASARPGVRFRVGGFEVPLDDGRNAGVIRAMNVLRQYDEADVPAAWQRMSSRLAPGGTLVEGTCDEIGRIASWVDVTDAGPASLTISLRLAALERPSVVAERLPKALIHRNVSGERVHDLLGDADRYWAVHAPLSSFGAVQRWIATVRSMRDAGWPVVGGVRRWRLGELTVDWASVAPR